MAGHQRVLNNQQEILDLRHLSTESPIILEVLQLLKDGVEAAQLQDHHTVAHTGVEAGRLGVQTVRVLVVAGGLGERVGERLEVFVVPR